MIQDIDPTATVVYLGRIGIAVGETQVIRFGSAQDIEKELKKREQLPESLQKWCPKHDVCHSYEGGQALCESKHPPASDEQAMLSQWCSDRAELWTVELWDGSISAALKKVRPHKPLDFTKWSKLLKKMKGDGEKVPISVQSKSLRKLSQKAIQVRWHRGWVHGALIPRRIREGVLLSWHQARPDGLRGEDIAPFCTPSLDTPPDILIHVIKANWERRPLVAAEALAILTASFAQTKERHSECQISFSAHPGLDDESLSEILGCESGLQPSWKAARAKYRARNLKIGGVDILVQTEPEVSPKRDDDFFLTRKRRLEDLFSRMSSGIQLDEEGRYSLTPERHAHTIARWYRGRHRVLDACCGCGGNAIAFARMGLSVTAVDSNPKRLAMATHNAKIYGVDGHIDFVSGSFQEHAASAAAIFLDPPWSLSEAEILSWWTWAEQRFAHGAIKLPKDFPVPSERSIFVFCTAEGYPSFIVVAWGDVLRTAQD